MDIKEKAKQYAKERALEAFTSVIEQAFIDGYNEGQNNVDSQSSDNEAFYMEYVDLGLPSGTRWSSHYLMNKTGIETLPYIKASKLGIPTTEQYKELCDECHVCIHDKGVKFIGRNGNSIIIEYSVIETQINKGKRTYHFWLKEDKEGNNKLSAWYAYAPYTPGASTSIEFMGIKMPIMLVTK